MEEKRWVYTLTHRKQREREREREREGERERGEREREREREIFVPAGCSLWGQLSMWGIQRWRLRRCWTEEPLERSAEEDGEGTRWP